VRGSNPGRYGLQPLLTTPGYPRLAERSAWSYGYVAKVETGRGLPSPDFIAEACRLLDRRPSELFTSDVLELAPTVRHMRPRSGVKA